MMNREFMHPRGCEQHDACEQEPNPTRKSDALLEPFVDVLGLLVEKQRRRTEQ